jgi:hypothetical protein
VRFAIFNSSGCGCIVFACEFESEMAGERNCQRIGLRGFGSSILREKREAQLPLTDIAKVVLLAAPDLVITTFLSSSEMDCGLTCETH